MQSEEKVADRLKRFFAQSKPIIILGGVAGSGKTTMGNALLHDLGLDHRLGTGWIREILASTTTKESVPEFFGYSFRPIDSQTKPFDYFKSLSLKILPAVERCIERARREGQSLLIEGPMLIPGLLRKELYDVFFYLKKPQDDAAHYRALTTGTHTKRVIAQSDLAPNKEIEDAMLRICDEMKVPIIPFIAFEERKTKILKAMETQFLLPHEA